MTDAMPQGADPAPDQAQPGPPGAPSGKRDLLIAAVVLLAVIALAFAGYRVLGASQDAPSAGGASAARETTGDELWLSDYDAVVYAEGDVALSLSDIAAGRPLVVNFWATWCPYCIDEMGDFQEIYDGYSDRVSFAFVDAVDGRRETAAAARAWIEDNGYTLPVYYDTDQDAVSRFGVRSFPTTVVVAADGEIMTVSPGRIDPALMRSALDSLLQA